MGFEGFPKPKTETEEEPPELEPDERVLNPEEIGELGSEMNEYTEGLKTRIEEIKAELGGEISEEKGVELESELNELQSEYDGLKAMAQDIESGNFDEITEKPYKN